MTLHQRIGALFTVAAALSGCTGNLVYTAKERLPRRQGLYQRLDEPRHRHLAD
ncbi:hypothetical protein J2X66_003598 [Pseudomonas sp. 3296]|uniref:hypothetical protein n=1 Tax=Pseudomonas sp. 3296 TaxID=2817753 RepID=UPI002863A970|nr:hypothetical protein [Pseudomonas sp. 3296]MDR6916724.1 hypothetical protein [Pseudomonas sp. 3296]